MGIHDRPNPGSRVVLISELVARPPTPASEYCTSDDASSIASEAPTRPQRRAKGCKPTPSDYEALAKRLNSRSRMRRQSHLSFVRSLVGLEESEVEEEFLNWSPDFGKSAFTSLFLEAEKMRAWNNFVEMSEEDQLSVIKECDEKPTDNDSALTSPAPSHPKDSEVTAKSGDLDLQKGDRRKVHPSYSSEQCFQQISCHIKQLLTKRHLPMGLLESLEVEIREFFSDSPFSMFEPDVYSGFGRLLVHAVSQYLNLDSFSYTSDCNKRSMTVVNKEKTFNPPEMLLTEYLEWKSGKQQHA